MNLSGSFIDGKFYINDFTQLRDSKTLSRENLNNVLTYLTHLGIHVEPEYYNLSKAKLCDKLLLLFVENNLMI